MNAQQMLEHMQAIWNDPHHKNNWLYETAHDLSQEGSLDSHANSFRALAKFLDKNTVIDLYYSLRHFSMRSESEWRPEFLRFFKKIICESDLPQAIEEDLWLEGIDPFTGLPTDPSA